MKKSERTEKVQETSVPDSPGTDTAPESTEVKVKRGRKPKAVKKQKEAEVTAEANDDTQKPEAFAEAEPVPETAEETGTDTEKPEVTTEPDAVPEMVEEDGADTEQPEEGRADRTDTQEEPEAVAEGEPVSEEVRETETSIEPAEPLLESTAERAVVTVPVPVTSAQIVESPLKRMKQEFQQRALVIKEQMRNIQSAFITIGFQLHWIRENNMFRVLNYKNIYEYAEKECNIKKTTCGNLICIIENYAERDENGEVIESIADCYRNYSASQLVAMLGMPEELKEQVTPDMSVRAINRLRKGGTDPAEVVEARTVQNANQIPARETVTEEPVEDAAEQDNDTRTDENAEEGHTGGQQTGEQKADSPEEEHPGLAAADDTVLEDSEYPADRDVIREETEEVEVTEDTELVEPETGTADDVEEVPKETAPVDGDMLAEIDSYTDYQSMLDELDLIMKHVFSARPSVRVKIVCVHG